MKSKRVKRNIAVISTILILFIILIIFFASYPSKPTVKSFEQGFNMLNEIDSKYNTSFKTERLNYSMIPEEKIDPLMNELVEFNNQLEKQEKNNYIEALKLFVKARINILLSQKNWYLSSEIGPIGLARDGFRCSEIDYIIKASSYYNASWRIGLSATYKLDDLLREYQSVPDLWNLVGTDENKTIFYKSPFWQPADHFRENIIALRNACGIDFNLSEEALGFIDSKKKWG